MKKLIAVSAVLASIPVATGLWIVTAPSEPAPSVITAVHAAYAETPVYDPTTDTAPVTEATETPVVQTEPTPVVAPVATPKEVADMRVTDKDQRLCFNLLIEKGYGWDSMTSDKVTALLDYISNRYVSVCGAWYQVQNIAPVKVKDML